MLTSFSQIKHQLVLILKRQSILQ